MRVCVLLSNYEGTSSAVAGLSDDYDPKPWLGRHEVEVHKLDREGSEAEVARLVARGFDVFLNLCDGMPDEPDVAGVEVVDALTRLGAAYTGPDRRLFLLTKRDMKAFAEQAGVRIPAFRFVTHTAAAVAGAGDVGFPLIVKHGNGYASVGMTPKSVVYDEASLVEQVEAMLRITPEVLIERFIEGGECTVLAIEEPDGRPAKVLRPLQVTFPPGETFKHFAMKWEDGGKTGGHAVEDERLAARLVDATQRLFRSFGGRSYSRFDFRVDAWGEAWFLEVNTNCGIFFPPGQEGSADFILRNDPLGPEGFLEHLFAVATRASARA